MFDSRWMILSPSESVCIWCSYLNILHETFRHSDPKNQLKVKSHQVNRFKMENISLKRIDCSEFCKCRIVNWELKAIAKRISLPMENANNKSKKWEWIRFCYRRALRFSSLALLERTSACNILKTVYGTMHKKWKFIVTME